MQVIKSQLHGFLKISSRERAPGSPKSPLCSPPSLLTQRKAGIPVTSSNNQCLWGRRRGAGFESPIWLRPITTRTTSDPEKQQAMLRASGRLPSYRADAADLGFSVRHRCNSLPGSAFRRQRNRDQTPNFIKTNKCLILPAACLYSCSSCL